MTHEDRQGGRVTRLLVPAGIAAALVAGAVAYAGPASAVTPTAPTLTLTAPTNISNDNQAQTVSLKIDNSATGTAALPATDVLTATFTVPASLACGKLTFAQQPGAPALSAPVAGTSPNTCVSSGALGTAIAAGAAAVTYKYTLQANGLVNKAPTITGTIGITVTLTDPTATPATTVATSNSTSTNLVNPSAPSFNSAPPSAVVHQDYSYTLVNNPGFAKDNTTYRVYSVVTNTDNSKTCTPVPSSQVDNDTVFPLNNGLAFDSTTGVVAASGASLQSTDSTPPTYLVVASNGVGGAKDTSGCSQLSADTTDVEISFSIPVLFGDTAVNSLFGPAIYKLADNGVISGYGDGNFHGQYAVTRDQFAHFLAEYAEPGFVDGACSASNPSAFTDVPNSSLFCLSIQSLTSKGIVKGTSATTFNPSGTILREQMAAFIYRTHEVVFLHVSPTNVIDPTCTSAPFPDVPTSNLFCGDIQWVSSNHIAAGYPNGDFHPTYGVARQEAAQFIYKLGVLEDHDYA